MNSISLLVENYIRNSSAYQAYIAGRPSLYVQGIEGYPLATLLRLMARKRQGRLWLVCPTEDSALMLLKDLGIHVNGRIVNETNIEEMSCIFLSSSGVLLYSSEGNESGKYEQLQKLSLINQMEKGLIVTSLRAFVSPVSSHKDIEDATLLLKVGEPFKPQALADKLVICGYVKSPMTTMPGEFTIRGEVMDLFPFGSPFPYRLYAEWDTVGRICTFDSLNQQTLSSLGHFSLTMMSNQGQGGSISLIDSYFKKGDYYCFIGDQRLSTSYHSLVLEAKASYRDAFRNDPQSIKPDKLLFDFASFKQGCMDSLTVLDIAGQKENAYRFDIDGPRSYFGSFTLLRQDLTALVRDGWKICVFSGNLLQSERLKQMLKAFPSLLWDNQELSGGFGIPSLKVIALCEHEIFGRRRQVIKTLEHVQSSPLDSFVDLNEGDYVVHVNYGVGRFMKIDRVKNFDRERDYIKIEYADKEYLYVPIEQANLVQRYIGSEGGVPKLDKMGGGSWEHKKAKARKNAEDLAKHLIELYAKRKNSIGYAFSKDTDWQLQFEASFPFDETPDQLTCIEDIKNDMEKPMVMDRLVCGDVGYGKTEIAFRAVFKAVMSGKQVAFLAPTTILAEQHYRNFFNRTKDFPVRCAQLSRVVSKKDQKQILLAVAEGKVDVLFGTHRILQKDILYKDLGLLIIDEEQRFGVKDKERIKTLRTSIDCLSLSATPIPRTLYMSLLKIRDMSLLTTPPIARRPIETHIQEYDFGLIIQSIRKEVEREGQVFYLHNRIETLSAVVSQLQNALPDLIIESAHGQMDSSMLEDTMSRFVNEGIQVLVSTTIIENGIDIPNVNTIIIDRADLYGVSQLYQLRGRVGRNDRQAYAFLFYPSDMALSEIAVKRLKVISEHTELGSGFKVAMKDMEIRGTGNLLGREQSGQLASVGLDMYIHILDEAITSLQAKGVRVEDREVFLELDYTGFIPESYISAPSVKFDVYRRISSIKTESELQGLTSELSDRYGPIPEEVSNLLYIAEIKIICRKLSVVHLIERQGTVSLEFEKVACLNVSKVMALISQGGKKVWIDPRRMNFMFMKTDAVSLKDKALFLMEKLQRLL
ncbi:MAG: transcription-repair coupling factor [Sphaerochaetaceae bacterium]